MRLIYWFRNDLRLYDHPGLAAAAEKADELLLVYLWPRQRPWCNSHGLGEQRERFIAESLETLSRDLEPLGQQLLVLHGSPELVIPDLVRDYAIDAVHTSECPGTYEQRALRVLGHRLALPITAHRGNSLFHSSAISGLKKGLPGTFTAFRREIEETLRPTPPTRDIPQLPTPPSAQFNKLPPITIKAPMELPLRGGTAAGERRLRQFLAADGGIRHYKETRNGLDPLQGSSTLSPWIANGNLSVRTIAADIHRHEAAHGANDSTYWLYFELLWREFFYWRAMDDGLALFRFGGRRSSVSRCTFEPRNFARWCAGDTNFPLVNAFMHQLTATGWMSNRGRQIAASCLIYEYGIDWRYGAAFFEKHLIDYDVASNYGNWQYIAGVGADPRGGRAFDIAKQAAQYDPLGTFTAKWDGHRPEQPDYVTDAADWPLPSVDHLPRDE